MKVLSIGAGAVGGVVAARLARDGVQISVSDANAEHVRLLRSPGLRVDGLDEGVVTPLQTFTPEQVGPQLVGSTDLVLLAVRSSFTRAALESIAPYLRDDADVVSLQNGLNEDVIAAVVGAERTIGCVVGFGGTWISSGRTSLDATGPLTIGRLDGTIDARVDAARDLLAQAFPTKTSDNIRGDLWAKLFVNSTTVLGALGGMITSEVLGTEERRGLAALVVAEGVRVAMAEGVQLPPVFGRADPALVADRSAWLAAMEDVLVRFAGTYGAIRSVTWRDFELGRPTEIDAVTGEIVRRGEAGGVPTPLSDRAYAMLSEIERGERAPDPANFDALLALSPSD